MKEIATRPVPLEAVLADPAQYLVGAGRGPAGAQAVVVAVAGQPVSVVISVAEYARLQSLDLRSRFGPAMPRQCVGRAHAQPLTVAADGLLD